MPLIDKTELCQLIPHSGAMCLLDEVLAWDDTHIQCRSYSHQAVDNPLRNAEGLPTIALVEYGAQAMAVHGGLLASARGERIDAGYLAALRDVSISDMLVDGIASPLLVEATMLLSQQGNMIYQFSVTGDAHTLVSGRATVMSNTGEQP